MKIKSQFAICIIVFSIILVFIAASVAVTEQQVTQINAKELVAGNIEQGASSLNSIAVNYFLLQEDLQLSQWQTTLSSLSSDLTTLKSNNPQQQTLASNVDGDLQRLNASFADVVSYLQSASRNVSVRIDPAFQTRWSSVANQSQTLASDSSRLSSSLDSQGHQTNDTNVTLIVSLVVVFGVFLATIYLMVFRRTLKSVANLQKGINTIGSGNLDYSIKIEGQNEITELSNSFNQMTTNLKTVTASKTDLEQAQASLRESEQRWATTLASIGDAVIATDVLGKVVFMNGVAEEVTGWTMSEASLKPVKEIFNIINEHTRKEVEDPVSKVLEKGLIVGLANHTVLIRKDGKDVSIDDSGAPIRDKEGKTTGVVLIFRDISERKKAEIAISESEERFSKAFHNSPVPQIITRLEDFRYVDANESLLNLLEYNREELVGHTSTELNLIDSSKRDQGIHTVRELGELRDFETNVRTKSGKIVTVLTSSETIAINGQKHLINTFIDVTLSKQMQAKLEEYSKHLEALVEERTKQLKDAERLAAIGATAGMVGHDIRNPLQAITSDVYLAKEDLSAMPESEERKSVQESLVEIEKNIYYINKIVADLQDFAKPLSPKLEEVDLEQTVHQVLAHLNIPGNVTVKHSIKKDFPKLKTDQSFIQRILTNLANNAIQAMPKGGKLTIAATFKNGKATITVQDTGEGIPEDVRGKLFTPLVTTKSKGQGFGLAVVKRFTEGLGGTVTYESEVGNGTKFAIELPADFS